MQIELAPESPTSGGYGNIATAMDVFSCCLFAYPTSNQDAKTIAKVLINVMTKRAYLPTTLISDKGTAFMSHVIKDVAGVLGIILKHTTTKQAQTIGLLQRSHASIKQALKIETGERRSLWHIYLNIAVLNYDASYHTSIGSEPSRVFHGRIPYNNLDLIMGTCLQQQTIPTSQTAQDALHQTEMIHQGVRKNAMQAYIKKKLITTKRPTLQSSEKHIMYTSHSPKRITTGEKLPLQNFSGLGRILLKRCYRTTIMWYAKLAPTRRKCFIVCECGSLQPTNPQLTYESRHKNIDLIRK